MSDSRAASLRALLFASSAAGMLVAAPAIVYPDGRPAPQLTADGTSTISDPDGVELYVWDCNKIGRAHV